MMLKPPPRIKQKPTSSGHQTAQKSSCVVAIISLLLTSTVSAPAYTQPPHRNLTIRKDVSLRASTRIIDVAWSKDGATLATLSDYGFQIHAWTRNGRTKMTTRLVSEGGPFSGRILHFIDNDDALIGPSPKTSAGHSPFAVWNVKNGKLKHVASIETYYDRAHFSHSQAARIAISKDEKLAAVLPIDTRQPISVFELTNVLEVKRLQVLRSDITGDPSHDLPSYKRDLVFDPTGNRIYIALPEAIATVDIDSTSSGLSLNKETTDCLYGVNHRLALNATGTRLAVATLVTSVPHPCKLFLASKNASLRVYDSDAKRLIAFNADLPNGYIDLSWNYHGNLLAGAGEPNRLRVYRFVSDSLVVAIDQPIREPIERVAFSPTENAVAILSGGIVHIFKLGG